MFIRFFYRSNRPFLWTAAALALETFNTSGFSKKLP
jgi:hypothetical protein